MNGFDAITNWDLPDDWVWEPDLDDLGEADPIRAAVFQALGAASMCWEGIENAGAFQAELAAKIGDGLMGYLNEVMLEMVLLGASRDPKGSGGAVTMDDASVIWPEDWKPE